MFYREHPYSQAMRFYMQSLTEDRCQALTCFRLVEPYPAHGLLCGQLSAAYRKGPASALIP